MTMKRGFAEMGELDHRHSHIALANCLMLLSRGARYDDNVIARVFECKTCSKKFPSFQALGGHMASHKKPRLSEEGNGGASPTKPKTHECSICGLKFPVGQALGGHMRRHRAALNDKNQSFVPIVKKPTGKRVLWLDLNLTPTENIDLQLGKATPIDC